MNFTDCWVIANASSLLNNIYHVFTILYWWWVELHVTIIEQELYHIHNKHDGNTWISSSNQCNPVRPPRGARVQLPAGKALLGCDRAEASGVWAHHLKPRLCNLPKVWGAVLAMFQNGRLTDCQMQVIRIGRYLHRRSQMLLSLSWSLSLLLLLFLLLLVVVVVVVAVVWCLLFLSWITTMTRHPCTLRISAAMAPVAVGETAAWTS